MRKEFSAVVEKIAARDRKVIFLTGDLGFMALENVQRAIGKRFINAGVSEQNMVSMAAALALEGLTPICYSIAPFLVFRPAEQIRLDVCLHDMDVKLVGNGGGYGYGIMGATHHAIEDIAGTFLVPEHEVLHTLLQRGCRRRRLSDDEKARPIVSEAGLRFKAGLAEAPLPYRRKEADYRG